KPCFLIVIDIRYLPGVVSFPATRHERSVVRATKGRPPVGQSPCRTRADMSWKRFQVEPRVLRVGCSPRPLALTNRKRAKVSTSKNHSVPRTPRTPAPPHCGNVGRRGDPSGAVLTISRR